MNKTMLIAVTEVRTTLRRKTFVIFAFGLPLLMGLIALVIGLVNRDAGPAEATVAQQPASNRVGYVDPGHLIQELPKDLPADWLVPFLSSEEAQQAMQSGEIDGYYFIPKEYVAAGELVYTSPKLDLLSPVYSEPLERILLYNLAGGNEELAQGLWQPLDLSVTSLAPADENEQEENWIVLILPTMMTLILYMVIIITSSMMINAITDEKKNRVMEIILSSTSSRNFVAGKIIAGGLLGFLMVLIWLGVLWLVANFGGSSLDIPLDFKIPAHLIVWAIIYSILGYAIYGALMAGLGALTPDVKDARGLSMVVLAPIIFGYMFNTFIQINPDGIPALIVSLFPLTAPVTMIIRMSISEVPVWQAVLAALLTALTSVWIVWLVARLFRAQILLSGQPPSVRRFYQAMLNRG